MKKYNLQHAEFYITNVCNFNCNGCNRFNNYYFSGQEKWGTFVNEYTKWGDILHIEDVGILGGEPLLNPDIIAWIDGISNIWSKSNIEIVTNGTHINRVPNLYDTIKQKSDRIYLSCTLHNEDRVDFITTEITKFLGNDIETNVVEHNGINDLWKSSYDAIKDESWPICDTPHEFQHLPHHIQSECQFVHNLHNVGGEFIRAHSVTHMKDENGVLCTWQYSDYFNNSALIESDGVFSLHDSNPKKALDVCYSSKCHHFMHGKLYKCGVVGLLPEFYKQFHFDISEEDIDLIHSYTPLSFDSSDDDMEDFMNGLLGVDVIPQCKFCPENFTATQIKSSTDKTRINKKKP